MTELTEAEEIKKRWQDYIEDLYKKSFNDQDNHDDLVRHLSWTLWTVKSSGS